jgi:transposase-like protein
VGDTLLLCTDGLPKHVPDGDIHALLQAREPCRQLVEAATRVLTKAIRRHGEPEKVTIDGSEANAAALRHDHAAYGTALVIRQVKYLHKIIEQDHPGVQRVTRPR